MKPTLTTKVLTIIFFVGMISTYVAYSIGVFDPQRKNKSRSNHLPAQHLQANYVVHPIDTPPANDVEHLDTSSAQFNIMMSSKTLFPAPQMSTLLLDTNASDLEKEVQTERQSNQQINAPPTIDSLHK